VPPTGPARVIEMAIESGERGRQPARTGAEIDPDTAIGAVRLRVADIDRAREFYEQTIGLRAVEESGDLLRLGVDGATLIELLADPQAPPRPRPSTGLFHMAILMPSRRELAEALGRIDATRWRLSGASDHLVSEALYLSDPEGNGIEIYRDRAREEWSRRDGEIEMATLPLDVAGLADELGERPTQTRAAPAATRVGHVHLNVADLPSAERFYCDVLGFEAVVRSYPGALFVSAGGYHHHVGLNVWAGEGAPAPPAGSRGLEWFEIALPDREALDRIASRLRAAGFEAAERDRGLLTEDPSGNGVLLRNRSQVP
jgi:catechol 2,3-dioxygenase